MSQLPRWVSLRSTHLGSYFLNIVSNSSFARSSPSGVKTIEDIPVEALPGPVAVMECEVEQRQRCVVNLVCVEGHCRPLAANPLLRSYSGSNGMQPAGAFP